MAALHPIFLDFRGIVFTCLIHEFNFVEIQGVGIRRNSGLFQGFRNAEAPKIKSKFSFKFNIVFYHSTLF